MYWVARGFGACFTVLGLSELFQVPLGPFQHSLVVFCMCCFCLTHSVVEWGRGPAVLFFLIVYVTVAVAEGFSADFVFGAPYHFTRDCSLGPHVLFGRPLFLPVAWYVCSYPAWWVATRLIGSRSVWFAVAVASLLTMFSDVIADPVLSTGGSASWIDSSLRKPEWIWHVSASQPQFEGVPISNFLGWLLVSSVYFGVFALCCKTELKRMRDPWSLLLVNFCISVFYLVS